MDPHDGQRLDHLLLGFAVRSCLFQDIFHLFDGYYRWIVDDSVYLPEVPESRFDFLYSRQPFQGRFADVVSSHVKDHLCFMGLIRSGETAY